MEELKPCPFCGSIDIKIHVGNSNTPDDTGVVFIYCNNCGVHGGEQEWDSTSKLPRRRETAIKFWNQRKEKQNGEAPPVNENLETQKEKLLFIIDAFKKTVRDIDGRTIYVPRVLTNKNYGFDFVKDNTHYIVKVEVA
jgi:Lar family restriction alleviation protein